MPLYLVKLRRRGLAPAKDCVTKFPDGVPLLVEEYIKEAEVGDEITVEVAEP